MIHLQKKNVQLAAFGEEGGCSSTYHLEKEPVLQLKAALRGVRPRRVLLPPSVSGKGGMDGWEGTVTAPCADPPDDAHHGKVCGLHVTPRKKERWSEDTGPGGGWVHCPGDNHPLLQWSRWETVRLSPGPYGCHGVRPPASRGLFALAPEQSFQI